MYKEGPYSYANKGIIDLHFRQEENDYMIKIKESKLLIEKELDDILRGPMSPTYPNYRDSTIAKYLASYNVDIENTTFTRTDPSELKKDQDILFIFALESYTYNSKTHEREPILYYRTCLYKHGEKYIANQLDREDTFIDSKGNRLSLGNKDLFNASFNFLVKNCYAAYVLDLKSSRQKKMDRRDARSGSVDRIDPDTNLWDDNLSVDKSGYIVDKDKYRKMLAAVNKDHYTKYFDTYINLYNEVQQFLTSVQNAKFSLENDPEGPELTYTNQKKLMDFIKKAKDNLAGFAMAFRKNNQQDLVYYSDRIKDALTRDENEIRSLIK